MRAAPTYPIYTWRQASRDESELRYRPTLRTVLHRLAITFVCLLFAALFQWGQVGLEDRLSSPSRSATAPETIRELQAAEENLIESMRGTLGEAATERIVRQANAERELRAQAAAATITRFEQTRRFLDTGRHGLIGLFVLLGVYAPLSCLWNRVTISRTPEGQLAIKSFMILPRTTYWPLDDFYAIRTFAMEHYGFRRRGGLLYHRWEWLVQLSFKGRPHLPFHGSAGLAFSEMSPQFHIHRERHQPSLPGRAPEVVRDLVKGLRAVTGLKAEPPQLIEGRIVGRKRVVYNATLRESQETPVAHEQHVFRSGDPIPEDIKARIAAMTGNRTEELPCGALRSVSQQIIVDEDGRKVTYNSIDELPEHIRRRLGL